MKKPLSGLVSKVGLAEPESSMTLALVRLSERRMAHTPRLPSYKTPF